MEQWKKSESSFLPTHEVPQTPYPHPRGMLAALQPPLNPSELQAPARASPNFQGRTGDVSSTGHPPRRGKPMAMEHYGTLELFEVGFFFGTLQCQNQKTMLFDNWLSLTICSRGWFRIVGFSFNFIEETSATLKRHRFISMDFP